MLSLNQKIFLDQSVTTFIRCEALMGWDLLLTSFGITDED